MSGCLGLSIMRVDLPFTAMVIYQGKANNVDHRWLKIGYYQISQRAQEEVCRCVFPKLNIIVSLYITLCNMSLTVFDEVLCQQINLSAMYSL